MRPARPRNQPWRRNDDRWHDAPPPDDRGRDRGAPGNDYGPASDEPNRNDAPRGRRPSRATSASWNDEQPEGRHRPGDADPYDPYNPYDTGRERFAAGQDADPYRGREQRQGPRDQDPRERFQDDRAPGHRSGRVSDDRSAAPPPTRRPAPQRYGAISPTDDLSWPNLEPAEADWQPARPGRRSGGGRSGRPDSRQPETDRDDRAVPERDERSARSGEATEPDDRWSDDLTYDVYADDPVEEPAAGDRSGGRRGAGHSEPDSDGDPLDMAWDQPARDDDPPGAWTGGDGAGDAVDEPLPTDDPRAALFASPERPGRRSSGPRDGIRPPLWGMSGYAWRFARKLTIPRTNRLLRLGASRVLPASTRARFEAMGLPRTEIDETLAQVRSLDDWAEAWTGTAQRFLGETRRGGDMTPAEAARSRQLAALCYHVASFFAFGDERLARTSRSASTTLFAQSAGLMLPETRQVSVRWRAKTMPGYLTVPSWATGRRPLAVLLNGATTSREEMTLWSDEFLAQGVAVLALDTPGFGQGSALGSVSLDNDDIMDGIVELAEADPGLDASKISLVGISLGGTMALRAAAGDRRVSAIVAVTPLHEPARWLGASSQVSLAQIVPLFGGYDQLADFVLGLDMATTLAATEAQVLVFGAGRDLVVPPPEASRLASALSEQATLVWFDDAGHALFDVVPEWTREAAEWLAVVMDVADAPIVIEQSQTDEAQHPFEPDRPGAGAGELVGDAPSPDETDTHRDDAGVEPAPPGVGESPARASGWRRQLDRRSPARTVDPETVDPSVTARPPEPQPQPYGAGVFDAEQAEHRRTGQQRGYETGAFGPLGPAAARILADEPTPEPGSADWGYEDGNPWTEQDQSPAWSDERSRPAPETARLWVDSDRPVRPDPVLRRAPEPPESPESPGATESSRGNDAGDEAESSQPAIDIARGNGDYLLPSSPVVGRGRISESFSAVPPGGPTLARDSGPTGQDESGQSPTDQDSSRELSTPDERADGRDEDGGQVFRPRMATPGDTPSGQDEPDTHAAFRPPSGLSD